jgi:hypothetical protein
LYFLFFISFENSIEKIIPIKLSLIKVYFFKKSII